jgi:hypothetical protein
MRGMQDTISLFISSLLLISHLLSKITIEKMRTYPCQGCSYSQSLLARLIYIFRDLNGVLKVSGFSYGIGFCEHLYTNC